jgi:hypothetical protein
LWLEAKVQYDHYQSLARWFRMEAQRRAKAVPFAGGVNVDDVDTRKADTSIVQPNFTIGMQDSVLASSNDDEELE